MNASIHCIVGKPGGGKAAHLVARQSQQAAGSSLTLYVVDIPSHPSGLGSAGVLLSIYADKARALDLARETPGARVREIPPSRAHGSIYWPAIDGTVIG